MAYVTTEDIVIEAGTVVQPGPDRANYLTPHGDITIAFGPDATGTLRFDLQEAADAGVIQYEPDETADSHATSAQQARMTGCQHCDNGQFENTDVECVNGILIDIDEFNEGWQVDLLYPPAPCHPLRCTTCDGSGEKDGGDCEGCDGTGYRGTPDCQERLAAA